MNGVGPSSSDSRSIELHILIDYGTGSSFFRIAAFLHIQQHVRTLSGRHRRDRAAEFNNYERGAEFGQFRLRSQLPKKCSYAVLLFEDSTKS